MARRRPRGGAVVDEPNLLDVGGPGDRMLNWREVQAIAGISRTTVWRLQQMGAFPKPVSLSPGRVCWWETEVMAWRRSRKTEAFKPPKRPRLPGMTRRTRPGSMATQAADPKVEATPSAEQPKRRRSTTRRAVSPNQIDFGF